MLQIIDVTHRFGGLLALNAVNLVAPQAKVTALIGPNGAGKTTLINDISGLSHPTNGTLRFNNVNIEHAAPYQITRLGIARTYQNIRLFGDMTSLENLLVAQHGRSSTSIIDSVIWSPRYRHDERHLRDNANRLLERFNLAGVAHKAAGSLPYGDQRRLEMARALATNPKLLLLDEPTAGMNPIETQELGEQIIRLRGEGLTVVVIEHDMSLIRQVSDVIYVLNFGQIIAHGTPDEVTQNPDVIAAYLGKEDEESA